MRRSGWLWAFLATACMALAGCGGSGSSPVIAPGIPNPDGSGTVPGSGSSGSTSGSATFLPNYASETDPQSGRANVLYHWAGFPVRVWFDSTNSSAARQAAATSGFDWWARDTSSVGAYVVVPESSTADIQVHFQYAGQTGYAGLTRYSYNSSGQLGSASIMLNLSYLEDNSLLVNAAAHEFGHAMGVGGHSTIDTDLMAFSPNIYTLSQLSVRDLNTIKTDYSWLYGRSVPDMIAPRGPFYTAEIACSLSSTER